MNTRLRNTIGAIVLAGVASTIAACDGDHSQDNIEMIWEPIYNEPPVARFDVGPAYATGTTSCINKSFDPNLDPLIEYNWTFGDGSSSTLANPRHRFEKPGDYLIELEVFDDHLASAKSSKTVSVQPTPMLDLILHDVCMRETGDGSGRGEIYLKIIAFNGRDTTRIESNTLTYSVPPGGCIPFGNRLVAYSAIPQDYIAFILIAMDHDDVSFWLKIVEFAKTVFETIATSLGAPPEVGKIVGGLFEIADYAIKKAGEDDVVFIFNDVLLPSDNWYIDQTINVVENDHPYSPAAYVISYSVRPH